MPRGSVKTKVYKTTILKGKAKAVQSAAPASEKVTPELKELVDFAQPAVEVAPAEKSAPAAITKSSSKRRASKLSTKQLAKKVARPLKMRALRRTAVKAAKKSSAKPASASADSESTSKSSLKPQELVDGVKIRIREPRRGSGKVAEKIIKENTAALAEAITGAGVKTPKKPLRQKKLLKSHKKTSAKSQRRRRQLTRADLINAESKLGSTIFGPVPAGHRREFFHDQQNIWIWHEGWIDEYGHTRQLTVRYEVRPSGVYKKLSAGKYLKLEGAELENFRKATHVYLHTIKRDLYHRA